MIVKLSFIASGPDSFLTSIAKVPKVTATATAKVKSSLLEISRTVQRMTSLKYVIDGCFSVMKHIDSFGRKL